MIVIRASLLIGLFGAVMCSSYRVSVPNALDKNQIALHKYSAIVAVTDGYRKLRDNEISKAINPFRKMLAFIKGLYLNIVNIFPNWYHSMNEYWPCTPPGESILHHAMTLRSKSSQINAACNNYEQYMEDAIRFVSMSNKLFESHAYCISLLPWTVHMAWEYLNLMQYLSRCCKLLSYKTKWFNNLVTIGYIFVIFESSCVLFLSTTWSYY